jgi:1,4-alpha-glucan branching enzyme
MSTQSKIVEPTRTRGRSLDRLITSDDIHWFNEGTHYRLYEKFGCHLGEKDGVAGAHFAVWAPNAQYVSVIGDFNGWDPGPHPMKPIHHSGIWHAFVPGIARGQRYKYHVASRYHGYRANKADPYAFFSELPPDTGSVAHDLSYEWNDERWMASRAGRHAPEAPMATYEVHLGSWMRSPETPDQPLSYRDIAPRLADYVERMGFTHVELMPVMEHPYYASWGYQATGYFAPTSRYGSPLDFMHLIDVLHQRGIGVILDWAPAHFPSDEHGLVYFDGTHLYEHADPRQRVHPDWGSYVFNYSRNEVRAFLISSAMFWLDKYHIDGLRVDAVASMLYLDYSRAHGEWVPNKWGGRENIDAIDFIRKCNEAVYESHPDVMMIAEESTAWPMVSRPIYLGGLGYGYKWDMGWMHDTLAYITHDPIHRAYHHNGLTFRQIYAFTENFILPLSHDEVVHGKGSLLSKMPGDEWQKFANLRLLLSYMWTQTGKKLLFMGGEFGQRREWAHDESLDWHLLEHGLHRGVQNMMADLNRLLRHEPALHECDCAPAGFEWVDCADAANSVIAYLRKAKPESGQSPLLVACNFTPVVRYNYWLGLPSGGYWQEIFNSDAGEYGGSGQGNLGRVGAVESRMHGRPFHGLFTLPPLAVIVLKGEQSL